MCIHIHLRCTFHYQYLFAKTFMCPNMYHTFAYPHFNVFYCFRVEGYAYSNWTFSRFQVPWIYIFFVSNGEKVRQVQSFFCSTLSFNYCYYYYHYFPKKATKLFPWKISMFMHLWNKFNGQFLVIKTIPCSSLLAICCGKGL